MIDPFGRTIDSLRISVTDRCNLRCAYCMPSSAHWLPPEALLRFEEIVAVAEAGLALGIRRFRLTGGEPLLRRGLTTLVARLADLQGIEDLAMTTNGLLLQRHAQRLAAAGLRRVNVSLDAVDPARYAAITDGGDVRRALAGIRAAIDAGLVPVKLNCVTGPNSDPRDAEEVAAWGREHGLEVRFIREMNLREGSFGVVQGGRGGDCPRCNRLRLSSDGLVRPCLFSDLAFSVRELGPAAALAGAVQAKPPSGTRCTVRPMHAIGG